MSKVKSLVAAVLVVPIITASTAAAAPAGQVEGGDIYRVRNVTKNTAFTDPAAAVCGETVQFRVRIHNPGPDALTNVNVKATLTNQVATSHSSQVTITAENANPATTTDTAGVNLDKAASLKYVAGSAELLDANQSKLNNVSDSLVNGNGVNIGTVGVSTEQKRSVQFSATVECPTTPVTPTTPAAPATPKSLPKTGPAEVVATVAGVSILGAVAHRLFTSRRLNRQ